MIIITRIQFYYKYHNDYDGVFDDGVGPSLMLQQEGHASSSRVERSAADSTCSNILPATQKVMMMMMMMIRIITKRMLAMIMMTKVFAV